MICCNCKKESLIQPHICPECIGKLRSLQAENEMLREYLNKASQLLQDKGFEAESKAIDCIAEL
jgi:ribonucleotide reductase alpha subunit